MTEGESSMPVATLDLKLESPHIHPGTRIMAEVKVRNTGKTTLTLTEEAFSFANEFEFSPQGLEQEILTASSKNALASRSKDDIPRYHADPLILKPGEEDIDREDIAEYLPETLKPGTWNIRAARKLNAKDFLRSEWKPGVITPWQLGTTLLRFDSRGQHWQSTILNREPDGGFKLWTRISSGTHPASGTYRDVTEVLSVESQDSPEPEKISSISFAKLSGSTNSEWMLVKESENLRAIRFSGEPIAVCHGNAKGIGGSQLLESGIYLDGEDHSLFASKGESKSGITDIHFFKVGDGKILPVGRKNFENALPGQFSHCWVQMGGTTRLVVAYAKLAMAGKEIEYWTQEFGWDPQTQTVHAGKASFIWKDSREALAIQWDPSHRPESPSTPLAILFPTKNPKVLELIQLQEEKAPQQRSINLRPGMKPEKASLFTRADGQWALVVVSGNGILSQQPGSETWSLLSQEKSPVKLLRAARTVGDEQWAAWMVDGRGLKWAKIETGR